MSDNPLTVICPGCGSENPKISRCVRCGGELSVLEKLPPINTKDFIQKPKGLWFFIFWLFASLLRGCLAVTVAPNPMMFMVYSAALLVEGSLLYGLWKLKAWARYGMLFFGYVGLIYSIWAYIEVEVFVIFVIKVLIPAVIFGATVIYFHLPSIKQIFEEEPRGI